MFARSSTLCIGAVSSVTAAQMQPLHGRRLRLDHLPQLEQVLDEAREWAGGELPSQHVRVEQIPVGARSHARARLRPRFDQAFGRQHLDRLAQGRAAHAQAGAEVGLVGQHGARRQLAAQDASAQIVRDLAMPAAL